MSALCLKIQAAADTGGRCHGLSGSPRKKPLPRPVSSHWGRSYSHPVIEEIALFERSYTCMSN